MEASGQLSAVAALTSGERMAVPIEEESRLTPEPACEFWNEYPQPQIVQPVTVLTARFWF